MDTLKQSVLSIYVYYDDLKYTIIRKSPKFEWLDLISNIGGIMGIFLGTSFLSFVEIIDILVIIFTMLATKKIKNNGEKYNQTAVLTVAPNVAPMAEQNNLWILR